MGSGGTPGTLPATDSVRRDPIETCTQLRLTGSLDYFSFSLLFVSGFMFISPFPKALASGEVLAARRSGDFDLGGVIPSSGTKSQRFLVRKELLHHSGSDQ